MMINYLIFPITLSKTTSLGLDGVPYKTRTATQSAESVCDSYPESGPNSIILEKNVSSHHIGV
jgi:hypothetical protein